jgi:hypothetical protein
MKHALIAAAVGVLVCACSQKAPDSAPGSGGGAASVDIAGHWLSSCFDQGDGTFAQLDFDIETAQWALDYEVHGSASCDAPLATVHIDGPYAIEGASATVANAFDARFGFANKTITPHAQPIADALEAGGCGGSPWQLDQPQSVADDGCAAFGQLPVAQCPADYDLVARDGDALRFGKRPADNAMCSADARPEELSPLSLSPAP